MDRCAHRWTTDEWMYGVELDGWVDNQYIHVCVKGREGEHTCMYTDLKIR